MTEPEGVTQVRDDASRGKGGKGKAIIKRGKTEPPSAQENQTGESRRPPESKPPAPPVSGAENERDPQTIAKIQQRAYGLFEAAGRQHGHDLEHWLEAERQIAGSSDRCER
jgi:hypothetical protein